MLPARRMPKPFLKTTMTLALAALLLTPNAGCLVGTQFRAAALPAFQSGVSQILDGFVNGVFAAIAVEPGNSDTAAASP